MNSLVWKILLSFSVALSGFFNRLGYSFYLLDSFELEVHSKSTQIEETFLN